MTTTQAALIADEPAPVRSHEIAGRRWSYTVIGEGPGDLLVLPGVLGGAELGQRLGPFLEGSYRILTVLYPQVDSLDILLEGIVELLDAESMDRVDIVSGSFGSLVAQIFIQRYPQRVRRLVVSGTALPEPTRATSNERFLRRSTYVPMAVFRFLLRLILRLALRQMPRPERSRWLAYYFAEVRRFDRRDLVSRYRLAIDFDRQDLSPQDLEGHEIEMLIVEGGKDRIASDEIRAKVRAAYPQAERHTIEGVGHGAALLRGKEWGQVVRDFLLRELQ
jgi:pimeloyl-ACP methyl ester carboxylesterase